MSERVYIELKLYAPGWYWEADVSFRGFSAEFRCEPKPKPAAVKSALAFERWVQNKFGREVQRGYSLAKAIEELELIA